MRRHLLALALLVLPLPASASTLTVHGDVATVSGVIGPNDGYGLKQELDALEASGTTIRTIALDSPGGSIDGAKMMGATIGAAGITTDIEPGAMCASACVLIFLSGKDRVFHATGRLGVHQSSSSLTHAFSAEGTREEVEWAGKYRAPDGVTAGMETTAPSDITWLTDEQVKAIGVRFVGDGTEVTTAKPFVAHTDQYTSDAAIQNDEEIAALRRVLHR